MRAILIVLDSAGVGELPDAAAYGDAGSNTIGNIRRAVPDMKLENMARLGLWQIDGLTDWQAAAPLTGAYGRLAEQSNGKDTTLGHWEIAGLVTETPFPTFPNGFPQGLLDAFSQQAGRGVIGNRTASGTEIIARLGDAHVRTGDLIVYTSADSVFQIAAHEAVVPIDALYRICEAARALLTGEYNVSRVIARPFIGESGAYKRTANRRDFSVPPHGRTMLDVIKDAGLPVSAVGKIEDIFAGRGMTNAVHTLNNDDGVTKTLAYMREIDGGLIFTNLVDFDMVYGHRNDVNGYADALAAFDRRLPEILANLRPDDLLILTADHGCDPTTPSTDHSREYIPMLAAGGGVKPGSDIGTRASFADIAATILAHLGIQNHGLAGKSFLSEITK